MDLLIFSLVNQSHTPTLDDVMLLASALGKGGFLWLAIAALAAVFPERRMAAWRVALTIGLTFLVVDGMVKPVLGRDRPFLVVPDARLIDQRPTTGSLPSGHAASAFAGAFAVSRLWPSARVAWWAAAAVIAVSRVYVGAHWPSDVVAGALLGVGIAWFTAGGRLPRLPDGHRGTASAAPAPDPR